MTTREWTAAPSRPHTGLSWLDLLTQVALASLVLVLIGVLSVVLATGLFERSYAERIYPGVHVWGVNLSGLTQAQAAEAIASSLTSPQSVHVTFRDGNRTWTATLAELGLKLDAPATAAAAYAVGRNGQPWGDLPAKLQAWWVGMQLSPIAIYNRDRAQAFLTRIQAEVDQPMHDASIIISPDGAVQATPSQVGRQLDVPATLERLTGRLADLRDSQIELVIHETPPLIPDATAAAEHGQRILRRPLELYTGQEGEEEPGPWVLYPKDLAQMAVVRRVDSANGPQLEVGLNEAKLRAFIEPITATVAIAPQDARFDFDEKTHKLIVTQPSRDGRSLDVDATVARVLEHAADDNRRIPLVFKDLPATVSDQASAQELGITELVSEGVTYFKGSPKERVTNIRVAAARFNGVVVPPGATFSFNDYLGDVSLDAGFAEALIIYNGRTIQGVGGGVCQVSTTAFRAAFFGGYPIVERYPHAYRVGWYEKGFGPGLDATVFAPLVDFKFKNDRPYYLLITTSVNESTGALTYRFYSTSDGRKVKVDAPVIENIVPHGPAIYEDDPTLPPGTVKQVDWAVDGADVTVTRVVTRDGQELYKDVVFTRYEPWQAVYKLGPGASPPSPSP